MAKSKFKKLTAIKDTEGGNFGNYDEANGGGSPKGGVWGGKDGRVGWDKREKAGELKQGDHRQDQPRTKDGKFTYNSTNGKETKYESRGKTVNPLLTGGENGIKIEDAKKQFADKQGSLYDQYKDKWFRKGDKLVTKNGKKYQVRVSANDIWEIARVSFDISKDAFNYETENFDEVKKGRHSKDEIGAFKAANKAKQEQFVQNPTGGIQQVKNAQPGQQLSTGIPFQLNPSIISKLKFRKMMQSTAGGTQPGQPQLTPAQSAATKLLAGKKGQYAINPNILSQLSGIVNQYTTQPVANQGSANSSKPKVSLGGFFNKPKP